MNFKVEKRVGVQATSERIWEVITDLEAWDAWNPVETGVSGAIAFGGTVTLTEALPDLPERQALGRIGDWQPNGQLLWTEKRGFLFHSTRFYRIDQLEPGSCIVANGFIFSGFRGEGFHDKHRKTLRTACEHVGEALRLRAEGL